MTHYEHGEDYSAATYDDTVTDSYGQVRRIIGETPRGSAWITLSNNGIRSILGKFDRAAIIESWSN